MLRLWHTCLSPKMTKLWMGIRSKEGFSLIELILTLSISSIIILSACSMLNYALNICSTMEEEDDILLNGRYAIEYIKREIRRAEEIIDIKHERFYDLHLKNRDNIGFVIMKREPNPDEGETNGKDYIYNFSTYYVKNNTLYRIAANNSSKSYPRPIFFGGHNVVAEHVASFKQTNIDFKAKIIDLCLTLRGDRSKETSFDTRIQIRCPVIY